MPPALADVGGQVLTVTASGASFALPAADVSEIIRPPALTRCPLSPGSLLGIANLRGAVLPVLSLAALASGEPHVAEQAASPRIVVIENPARIGLWVDAMPTLAPAAEHKLAPLKAWLDRDFAAALPAASANGHRAAHTHIPAAPQNEKQLITFSVACQTYALPVQDVLKTIAMPPGLTRLPFAGPEMLGVTQHRNELLPLISLSHLLGLPATPPSSVIVTRIGPHTVGLAVERIQAILRVPETAIDPVPPVLTRGHGEARISAICRHQDGRLIAILSPGALFDAATLERILAAGAARHTAQETAITDDDAPERFVGFRLGTEHYGVPAATVEAVLRHPPNVTRIPHAPDGLPGLINLRGRAVPLIDQRARFGARPAPTGPAPFVVMVTVQGRQAGLCVDGLTGMLSAARAQLAAAPAFSSGTAPVIDRIACIEREGRMIILVDPAALLTEAASGFLAAQGNRQAAPSA
jgi:purine-binding chemotaxis protein CheW